MVDFYHAAEHLKSGLDACYGEGNAKGRAHYEKLRHLLRHDCAGVEKVIRSLNHLRRTHPGNKRIAEVLGYFRNNRHRMGYAEAKARHLPIGSGVVAAACKTLVTQRLKRSGMRWRHAGGQAILTLRALIQSGRFDSAWELLSGAYRRKHSRALSTKPLETRHFLASARPHPSPVPSRKDAIGWVPDGTNGHGCAQRAPPLHRVPGFDADGRSSRSRLAALGFRPSKGPGQARAPSPPPYPRPLDARGRRDRRGVRGRGALSIAAPSERRRRDRGAETRQTACPGRTQGRPADAAEPYDPKRKSTRGLRPLDPRSKEVTIQGVSVRAIRNPTPLFRTPVVLK